MSYANTYQASTYRLFSGPNSNSAAAFPLYQAGASAPDVWNAPVLQYYQP